MRVARQHLLIIFALISASTVEARDTINTERQTWLSDAAHHAASVKNIYRVAASETPSGFIVPRYVSLKFGRVNARTGPSRAHPVAYQYQRRGLPLIVVAETEMWRKVRDIQGDEAWVRKPALSGERYAIVTQETPLRVKADSDARLVARIAPGALVKLEACEHRTYCRVRTETDVRGFVAKSSLWGAESLQ